MPSANKSAHKGLSKPRGDTTRSPNMCISGPIKGLGSTNIFLKKKKYLDSLIREARNQETQNGLQPLLFRYESRVDPDAPNKIIDAKRRQALKSKI